MNPSGYVRVLYPGGRITVEVDGLPLFDGRRGLEVDTRNEFPETTVEQAWLLAKNLVDDLRTNGLDGPESTASGESALRLALRQMIRGVEDPSAFWNDHDADDQLARARAVLFLLAPEGGP